MVVLIFAIGLYCLCSNMESVLIDESLVMSTLTHLSFDCFDRWELGHVHPHTFCLLLPFSHVHMHSMNHMKAVCSLHIHFTYIIQISISWIFFPSQHLNISTFLGRGGYCRIPGHSTSPRKGSYLHFGFTFPGRPYERLGGTHNPPVIHNFCFILNKIRIHPPRPPNSNSLALIFAGS